MIDYEEHGSFQTDDCDIDRWVCNHCCDDLPLDQGDIIEHLKDYHEDELK